MVSPCPSSTSLLFVDGDIGARSYWLSRLALSTPDCVVTTAEDGRMALKICKTRKFDCVVLELALPDISGFEVLATLCPLAWKPTVAVVILTKLDFSTLPPLAKMNGAQAYLMKSSTSGDQLDLAIRQAIATVGATNNERPKQARLSDQEPLREETGEDALDE